MKILDIFKEGIKIVWSKIIYFISVKKLKIKSIK